MSELIAANERDERCELLWGSPGTILAGRELGLDVAASVEWLLAQRDEDGLWTQRLFGSTNRCLGPAHGFAGCALALGVSPTPPRRSSPSPSRRQPVDEAMLWAGDLGVALYLADCVDGGGALPLP